MLAHTHSLNAFPQANTKQASKQKQRSRVIATPRVLIMLSPPLSMKQRVKSQSGDDDEIEQTEQKRHGKEDRSDSCVLVGPAIAEPRLHQETKEGRRKSQICLLQAFPSETRMNKVPLEDG